MSAEGSPPPGLLELAATLESLERQERIETLISIAERYRGVPESVARRPYPEERLVPGCESRAYVWATPRADGTLDFHFAVENPQGLSARAFAVILGDELSGRSPDEVLAVPTEYADASGKCSSNGVIGLVVPRPKKPFDRIRIRSTEFVEKMSGSAVVVPNSRPGIVG